MLCKSDCMLHTRPVLAACPPNSRQLLVSNVGGPRVTLVSHFLIWTQLGAANANALAAGAQGDGRNKICPKPPNEHRVCWRRSLWTCEAMLGTYKPRSSVVSQVACLRHKSAAIRARRSSWNVRNTRRESTQPPRGASPSASIHRPRTVPKSPGDRQGARSERWPT